LNNAGLANTGYSLFKCVAFAGCHLLSFCYIDFVTDGGNFKQKIEMTLTGENQSTKRKFWASSISSVTNPTCVMYWLGSESSFQQLRTYI